MRTSLIRVLAITTAVFWMGCTQTNDDTPSPEPEVDIASDVTEDGGSGDVVETDTPAPEDVTPGTVAIPFAVDDYFIPSGYMGAGETEGGIEVSPDCPSRPEDAVGSCHAFTLNPTADAAWGGVWWQHPEGNWGDSGQEGRRIAAGAKTVRFHAWSDTGGENVSFEVGMKGIDSFNAAADVVLTDTPTEYFVYIGHVEYDTVIGGFSWSVDSETSVSFYVDNIAWTDEEPEALEGCTDPNADNHVPGATVPTDDCLYAIDFSVDMGCSGLDAFETVFVTGTFCDWCDQGYPLADEDGDGVYTATHALPPGEYEYTYQVDKYADKENLTDDVAAGNGACAPKNSGPFSAEYANRVLTVETMPKVLPQDTYGSCYGCDEEPPAKPDVSVTFQVDMSQTDIEGLAGVAVCGSWGAEGDWSCTTMSADDAGVSSATITLSGEMSYQYIYKWFADEADITGYTAEEMIADDTCQVGGGNMNRLLEVGAEDLTLDVACWGQCGGCDVEPPKTVEVTFSVDMQKVDLAEGEGVAVCGSWNGWWPCTALASVEESEGDEAIYSGALEFTVGGEFEYVYKTFTDIENGETFTLEPLDGDGTEACQMGDGNSNRKLVIEEGMSLASVCWGLCGPCSDDVEIPGCMATGAVNHNPNATVDDGSCLFKVTFHADLSCSSDVNTSVFLNGPFNGWCGSCAEMTDEDEDGIFTLSLELAAGDHEFKYVTNGDQWEALDPTEDASCTVSTVDGDMTYTNRVVTVVDSEVMVPAAQPGSCEACPAPECGDGECNGDEDQTSCPDDCDGTISGCMNGDATNYNDKATEDDGSCTFKVDFKVDTACAAPAISEGDVVYVMGLDTWGVEPQMAAELTDEDGDGVWEGSWAGKAGDYEYIVSFGHWMADAGYWNMWYGKEDLTGQDCAAESGNRALTVEGPATVEVVHSQCGACPGEGEDVPGCTDESASNFNDKATVDNGSCVFPVTFQVDMSCYGDFGKVFVNGEFNSWCGGCWELFDEDGDSIYSMTADFPAGPVDFKYTVDSDWEALNPEDNGECTITSEDGQYTNRAINVTGPTVVDAAAPGSCEPCKAPVCGDGACTGDETPESCSDDCTEAETAEVHFKVEMGCSAPEISEGDVVYVMGLDNWGGDQIGAELQDEDGDGVWEGTWKGAPGEYEYVLSFGHWVADPGYWDTWYGKEDLTGQACAAESGNRTLSAEGVMELNLTHSHCDGCPGDDDDKAEIEFSVDMGCSSPELSEGDVVYVMGLDAWGNPDQVAVTLADEDGDGVWTGSWAGDAGSYEYTLSFGHWVADPGYWDMWFGHEDLTGQDCINPENGNRIVEAQGAMQVDLTHSYCDGCPGEEPKDAEIAFSVDMSCSTPALNEGDVVYVMGMDAWGNADQLAVELSDEDQDGIWTGNWSGAPGDYEYTLSFGHWEGWWNMWFGHEDLTGQDCINPESGNRTISAAGSMEVNLTHSYCDGCPAGEEKSGCTDADATNLDPEATVDDGSCLYPVTFQVDMNCYGDFGAVFLNGGFNEWCGGCWQMTDEDQDGIYSLEAELPKGGVEYKFTVDDTWETLQAGDSCTVTAGDFTNRYVEVTGPTVIDAAAPGVCSACE